MNFKLSADACNTLAISMQGPSGKGVATDILTKINDELYFIQPLTLKNGVIKILKDSEESDLFHPPVGEESITLPPIGSSSDSYGENTNFTYDFDMSLSYGGSISGGGSGSGSGANLVIIITFGDGFSTKISIPVQDGQHHYSGKIPIRLPSLKPGPIIIEMWLKPENEDDIYYWFIKAGALWGFDTEIPRDEVGELPIEVPHVLSYDDFKLFDFVEIEGIEPGPEPAPALSNIEVNEIMQFFDDFTQEDLREIISEVNDVKRFGNMILTDDIEIEYFE